MPATWSDGLLRLRRRAAAGFAARQYRVAQYLFLKLLALVYVIAFTSTAVQVRGLVGEHGILPLTTYFQRAHEVLGGQAYWSIPGVFWFASGDSALLAVCVLGALCGVLVLANRAVRPALAGAFLLYLSLVSAGRGFLCFPLGFLVVQGGVFALFLSRSLGGAGLSVLPMGFPAARGRVSRHFPRAFSRGCVPLLVAVIPAHAALGLGKVCQRRSGLAEPYRAFLPLRDAAAPYSNCLVRASAPGVVPQRFRCGDVRDRADRAPADLRAAKAQVHRGRCDRRSAMPDPAHGKLYVL